MDHLRLHNWSEEPRGSVGRTTELLPIAPAETLWVKQLISKYNTFTKPDTQCGQYLCQWFIFEGNWF